ncbi:MAG: T9SS type A sorting domain-containing protein [Flavobacteriales bacterium]|nr:T9SS type A sorting domain-containing protein [Flavobacteriales bacterium]
MKKVFVIAILLFVNNLINAQCPTIPIDLTSQQDIDDFSVNYPGCDTLPIGVDLFISGSDITNLSGLQQIDVAYGAVEIRNNPNLTSTSGLNLYYAGSDLIIRNNNNLNDISSFSNLDTILGEFTIRTNPLLSDLSGFQSLEMVGMGAIIRDNNNLIALNGLNQLTTVEGILEIVEHPNLNDISALSNVNLITGDPIEGALVIDLNPSLKTLNGFGNSNTIILGDLFITNNDSLSFCSVQSICNYLNTPPIGSIATIDLNITGCNNETEVLNQCIFVSVENEGNEDFIEIFPNPFSEKIMVRNTSEIENSTMKIYNLLGKNILQKKINNSFTYTTVNTNNLPSGSYILSIENNNKIIFNHLIIKN